MRVLSREWWQGEAGSTYTPSSRGQTVGGWWKRQNLFAKVFTGFVALALLGAVVPKPPSDAERVRAVIGEETYQRIDAWVTERNAYIEHVKTFVRASMKDPSSVQFGNVWSPAKGVVCGTYNGRNSFGAMAGWSRFVRDSDGTVWLGDDKHLGEATWNAYCR
jgi:hypothetical protein